MEKIKFAFVPDSDCAYEVRSDGVVISKSNWPPTPVKMKEQRYGLAVALYINGKKTEIYVHKLVADAFVPNPNGYKYVGHKDGNTWNNNDWNLEWVERKPKKVKDEEYEEDEEPVITKVAETPDEPKRRGPKRKYDMTRSEYFKMWREKHKEECRAYQNEYKRRRRLEDPEYRQKMNEYHKQWINEHKESIIEVQREAARKYQRKMREDPEYRRKMNQRVKEYYYAHREEILAKSKAKRDAKKPVS